MPRAPKKWLTISELAEALGLQKQTVSAHVARLEALSGLKSRRRGRSKLVDLDKFQALRAAEARKRDDRKNEAASLRREQSRKAGYTADLAEIEVDKRLAQLLPRNDVENGMVAAAAALTRIFNDLPSNAELLASAVVKDGATGARRALRELAFNVRRDMADAMRELAAPTSTNEVRIDG